MEEFFIDKIGARDSDDEDVDLNKIWNDDDDDVDDDEIEFDDNVNSNSCIQLDDLPDEEIEKKSKKTKTDEDSLSLNDTYLVTKYTGIKRDVTKQQSYVDKLLEEKSAIKPGLEKLHAVPLLINSRRLLQREKEKRKNSSKGKDWYNLPATEVTEEIKNDLDVLKMRRVLDSKHVYKHNDMSVTPKFFQIGKVVEGAADFYNGRIPKSQRKQTLVEELLADAEFKAYQKKKYKEVFDDSRNKKFRRAFRRISRQKKKEMKLKKAKERKERKEGKFEK